MAGRSQLTVQIMENRPRFDLNNAVESWRKELASLPNLAYDIRRELEAHLQDALTEFQERGLNDEESFWLAARRIGQPQKLSEEFEKAYPCGVWSERIFWMALGIISWQLTLILSTVAKIMLNYLTPGLHPFYQRSGFWFVDAAILIIGVVLAKGWAARSTTSICFFANRFRLALSLTALIILLASTQVGIVRQIGLNRGYDSFVRMGLGAWVSNLLHLTLGYLEYSIAPLILLILFFPPINQKTLGRA